MATTPIDLTCVGESNSTTGSDGVTHRFQPYRPTVPVSTLTTKLTLKNRRQCSKYRRLILGECQRMEQDNRELRGQLSDLRTKSYGLGSDGWTKHLSYEASPGDWYWYQQSTGDRVWDDWSPVEGEPTWWDLDDWKCRLTQYFQYHCPSMVPQIPRLLRRWAGNECGLWEDICGRWCDGGCDCEEGDTIYWCHEELEASHYDWYRSLGYTESQSELLSSRRMKPT
jgi:hypothetical protein